MSLTQTTPTPSLSDGQRCPRCDALLPPHATFCGSCGERVAGDKALSLLPQDELDITARYRITSLVRRLPYIGLYFAVDNQQQRMVAISDIDISSLDRQAQARAAGLVQREYDLLRRQRIPNVMPIIHLGYRQGHLFIVAGNPFSASIDNNEADDETEHAGANGQLHTLQELLQSGIGLPDERLAIQWIEHLCYSVDRLHDHQIVIGALDPETIVLGSGRYEGWPALMLSWLPLYIRTLLPLVGASTRSTRAEHFSAPETLLGKAEPRSDVYSLGAILYLLLTGVPPDEPGQRRQRSPRELNPRISPEIEDIILRALAFERSKRFQSALSLAGALANPYTSTKVVKLPKSRFAPPRPPGAGAARPPRYEANAIDTIDTIPVTPPPHTDMARWRAAIASTNDRALPGSEDAPPPTMPLHMVAGTARPLLEVTPRDEAALEQKQAARQEAEAEENSAAGLVRRLQKRITGILPAIQSIAQPKSSHTTETSTRQEQEASFLGQLQRFLLGEQHHGTSAAAIIETPLRVQPGQNFAIRIQLMGRDEAVPAPAGKKQIQWGGLSALAYGDHVNIEVRSAFYQRYAFVVQRALITIPATGYAAEVTIPMPPANSGPGGRRERLHIFFTDEFRRPLYEKPFVVELFISQLVRPGREGHQALPIPF